MSGEKRPIPLRVRFAPSPTGHLHVGGARTALINYLFAKNQKGTFVLRVEDTDTARGDDRFFMQQIEDLQWLGLSWDEGPHPKTFKSEGPYGPYRQSERLALYQKHARQLVEAGRAYYCFLTEEQTARIKQEAIKQNKPPHVTSPYRDGDLKQAEKKIAGGEKAVIRFKNPEEKKHYKLKDLVRGEVDLPSDMVGDFVLMRSSGLPVYNFACAVDDHLMKISYVFRSEEHLPNTLRQLMIFEAFGWSPPQYGHLSLILGEDRKKLSKRQGAQSCGDYRKEGYLSSALINFLALMGWNPKTEREVFSLSELVECFSLKGLNPAPGVFDRQKLRWMNNQHFKLKTDEELWEGLKPFLEKENLNLPQDSKWRKTAVRGLRDSFSTFSSAVEIFRFLSPHHFEIHSTAKEVLAQTSAPAVLKEWKNLLQSSTSGEWISPEEFSLICKNIQQTTGVKGKLLFMPIRTAVLGRPQGVELKVIVPLISKKALLERAQQVERAVSTSSV